MIAIEQPSDEMPFIAHRAEQAPVLDRHDIAVAERRVAGLTLPPV